MARLLHIRTKIRKQILTHEQEKRMFFVAMEEGLSSETLSEQEKTDFINSLGK